MGTKTNSRRSHRASRRGLASFVSFLLLFAFALGQSGSLIALADDAATDPVATEDISADSVSSDSALPAEEAPAQEAPAEEAPAEEAPAVEEGSADSGTTAGGGAASTSRPASRTRTLQVARTNGPAALARPAAALVGGLDGGDVGLDFVAAGPFTYNHATGLGSPPQFGYDNRTISKTNGVVESLEGGDFECGDLVTFFVQVEVEEGAAGSGAVELDMSFGNETTGQPGIGFDNIMSVAINTPDGGNVDLDGNETATLSNEHLDTQGYDEIKGTVTVSNLDPGETAIVRIIVHLACEIGTPTGNILNAIDAARVVGDGTVNVGQETVPMKQVGDVAQPGMNVDKTCPDFALVGDTIGYPISIENTGNEALNITSVVDTVDGHAGVNITASFPASVAAGATVTRTYSYTVLAGDPSPLTNSVAVVANGAISHATINGSASCENPILHPEISITKTCPQTSPAGDDITYGITIKNEGDETLDTIVVTDTVDGDAPVVISNLFASTLAPGASDSAQFVYDADGTEPDPLLNSATVTASGATSDEAVTDTDSCQTDITHVPEITVVKDCPTSVPFGQNVTFTITVTNTGNEPLTNVSVTDAKLGGNITAAFSIPNPMPVGVPYSHQFSYTPGSNEDPVQNSVTASGTGTDSGVTDTDTSSCETNVTHAPAIVVTKSCPETVAFGEDITYTITVTNTGNEALEDVTVNDTLLGDITDEFDVDFSGSFGVGEVATATVTYSPGADEDPVDNTVTATGNGADSGAEASDEASCRTDVTHAPGIIVTKACPPLVAFGEDITYTITVTNTGNEPLENLLVSDALLGGDITAAFNLPDPLPVGGTASAEFTYTPGADEDPVANSVTASADGVDSGVQATDTAVCTSDVSNPGISILKTVDEEVVPIGATVTFTYVVTNTGDVTLFNISVDDDIMGHIGDIASLDPGEDATLTKDFVVGDEIVTNIGTAVGHDILGREVSASDDATVAPIAGAGPPPNNPPTTPFTGSDAGRLGLITMVLFGIGVTVVASTRRRRPKGDAA